LSFAVPKWLDQPQLGQLLPELRRHGGDAVGGAALEVAGRILGIQIAPALEGTPRRRPHGDELVLQDQQAAGRAVLLGAFGDIQQRLAHLHQALDHPIERPARKQFVPSLGRLERAVEQARVPLAGLAPLPEALGLPGCQVLDRIAPHAQLDQMQGHPAFPSRAQPQP
jgi:hypothetical protein